MIYSNHYRFTYYFMIILTVEIVNTETSCSTPNSQPGNCVVIQNCEPIMDFMKRSVPFSPKVIEELRSYQCGVEGRNPKVCCPSLQSRSEWEIIEDPCSTPSGESGECIAIRSCQPMLEFMENSKPLTPAVIAEIRKYQCGFEGRYPKVCCPSHPIGQDQDPPDVTNHRNINLLPTNCGSLKSGDRILNGQKTGLFEFPWMALINYQKGSKTEFKCGATIINDRYILTAAHCLKSDYPIIGVRVGEHDLRTDIDCQENNGTKTCAPAFQDLGVEEIIAHPGYSTTTFVNDIGLIRVAKMTLKENVKPICLPVGSSRTYNFASNGNKVTVTGWGRTENFVGSPDLLKVIIEIFPLDQCNATYAKAAKITNKHICAGGKDSKDSCSGDSGGPLQTVEYLHDDVRYVQQGIVSFGPKVCGIEGRPGVYTKVAFYMQWILDNLRP